MENNRFTFDYNRKSFTFYMPNPEDHIQKKIIKSKTFYEIDLLEETGRFPLKEGIVCDIGANIGNHSIYFSSILNKDVYAFEPIKQARDIMDKNIELNGLEDKVKVFQVALGAEESKGIMDINAFNLGASRLSIVPSGDVLISTLDIMLDKNINVSVMKIDVEGFEVDVIKGAKKTIERCTPLIIAETQTHLDFLKITNLLLTFGYHPIGKKGATDTVFYIHESISKEGYSLTLSTYLLRQDIKSSRSRIQGQGDNTSRKIDNLLKLTQSISGIETNLAQKITSEDNSTAQKLESIKETLAELQNLNIEKLTQSISETETNLAQKILKGIESSRSRIQGQGDNTSRKIDKLLILTQNISEIEASISQKISSEDNITSEKLESIKKRLSELEKLLNHPTYNIANKNTEVKQQLKVINNYVLALQELNKSLFKKVYTLYSSNTWKYSQGLRRIFRKKAQSFNEYENKLSLKYGSPDELKSIYIASSSVLDNSINGILDVQNKVIDIVCGELPNNKNKHELHTLNRFSTLKGKTLSKKVFVGIAAIPSREFALKETVNSLINQVDGLGIYLNGWAHIPSYLKNDKIKIIRSQDYGDIGDAGKFYWVDNYNGYYFTCDDDIVYPEGYVSGILEKIKQYKFKAVIGWHGSLIIQPFQNYYNAASRRVFAFGSNRPDDTFVHILGTGTVGFHTSTIKVKLKDFIKPNMADVFFAELGQSQKVPFIVMKHEDKKMHSIEEVQADSINKHGINNVASKKNTKEFQNQLVKKINWKLFNTNKLKILMIGRFDTFTKGGIHKSNHLIKDTLESLGHDVIAFDSQTESFCVDNKIDVAIIYPGDPNRPDFEYAEKKMSLIREQGVPVCINMSYNTNSLRSDEIVKKIQLYNADKKLAPVFLMTFTDVSLSDSSLSEIKNFIVPMPKTVVGDTLQVDGFPEFSQREGIVLGDASKLMNTDITGGDIRPWIVACKKLLPHVKLYVFKQYGGKFDIQGVETVPYMKEGFLDWTSKRRIFVCLNTITTFEMTPTEAQIVGTPVIYRPMPQSLSEYVGRSGIAVTSPDEFAEMCAWIYNDQFAWDSYSNLSLKNSQTNKLENLSIGLETALRKVLFKTQSLKRSI